MSRWLLIFRAEGDGPPVEESNPEAAETPPDPAGNDTVSIALEYGGRRGKDGEL